MSAYGESITLAAGATGQLAPAMLPLCSRHTLQIEGAGTVTVRGRMAGATAFADIDTGLTAGIYTDLIAHRLDALQVVNTGGSAVTVHIAGGE